MIALPSKDQRPTWYNQFEKLNGCSHSVWAAPQPYGWRGGFLSFGFINWTLDGPTLKADTSEATDEVNRKSEACPDHRMRRGGKLTSNVHLVPYSDFQLRTSDFKWRYVQSPVIKQPIRNNRTEVCERSHWESAFFALPVSFQVGLFNFPPAWLILEWKIRLTWVWTSHSSRMRVVG